MGPSPRGYLAIISHHKKGSVREHRVYEFLMGYKLVLIPVYYKNGLK